MAVRSARSYLSGLLIGDEIVNPSIMLGADAAAEMALSGDHELGGFY